MDKLKVEQAILDGYSADSVAEQLEEMMFQMESPWSVLRLMCLSSITQVQPPPSPPPLSCLRNPQMQLVAPKGMVLGNHFPWGCYRVKSSRED